MSDTKKPRIGTPVEGEPDKVWGDSGEMASQIPDRFLNPEDRFIPAASDVVSKLVTTEQPAKTPEEKKAPTYPNYYTQPLRPDGDDSEEMASQITNRFKTYDR